MSERLTITIDGSGGEVSVDTFTRIVRETLEALDVFDRVRRGDDRDPPEWHIVGLSKNNPATITLESRRAIATASFLAMMSNLEKGKSPSNVPTQAVVRARRITKSVGKDVNRLEYDSPRHKTVAASRAHDNAISAIGDRYYENDATIEGRLQVVSLHNKFAFSVYDELEDYPVRCVFSEDELPTVRDNLNRRVSVTGIAKYRADSDRPISIKMDRIEPLDNRHEPKLISEMPRIDITGGDSSEEYIRRMRDGE